MKKIILSIIIVCSIFLISKINLHSQYISCYDRGYEQCSVWGPWTDESATFTLPGSGIGCSICVYYKIRYCLSGGQATYYISN